MTAESEYWTTAQLWVFQISQELHDVNALLAMKKNVTILTKKSCLSVLLNHFKRLFHLLEFLTLRFDAF